jgi:hypothetical protein
MRNRPYGRFLGLAGGLIAIYGLSAVLEWVTFH